MEGVTCIRLDASVVTAHSDKELAEPNFKGFGHQPLLAYCDNTAEPLAGKLRKGSAGSNTVADHLEVLAAAITALPPAYRRRLMVTCDGAGASHGLIERLDALAARPGHRLIYPVGWELGQRERAAIALVPAAAWQIAIDHRGQVREHRAGDACNDRGCGHRKCWIEEAHVTELTALLRSGRAGDQLAGWPASMRVFARRERPHPGAQLSLFEAEDGWRYSLWVTNLRRAHARLARPACLYRRRPPRARTGGGLRPHRQRHRHRQAPQPVFRHQPGLAWPPLTAVTLLALDRHLAKAEPKTLRYRILHAAARLTRSGRRRQLKIAATWPWAATITTAWQRLDALPQAPDQQPNRLCDQERNQGPVESPATRPASRSTVIPQPKINIHYAVRPPPGPATGRRE